ncbi:MAG: hypothetical protein ACUVRS_12370 [Armatimonadota bacterium]
MFQGDGVVNGHLGQACLDPLYEGEEEGLCFTMDPSLMSALRSSTYALTTDASKSSSLLYQAISMIIMAPRENRETVWRMPVVKPTCAGPD